MSAGLGMSARTDRYVKALRLAYWMMGACEGLEPTSALRQAATDAGIPEGDATESFVQWALSQMGL